jgi:methionyl aminopeptidase
MIYYKTDEEIELIRESCHLVCKALALVGGLLKPGVSGKSIDKAAEEFIHDHQAKPAFKGYRGFPATLCISVNECVVHGIPSESTIQENDIVSIDCGVQLNGYFGDAAYTFAMQGVEDKMMDLLRATNISLYRGIDAARVGKRLGDIGFAVQDYIQRENSYSVVRELVGHGLGKALHEEPEVPNYGKRGQGMRLHHGLVIAIEPMVNFGVKDVVTLKDGWTVVSKDRKPAAHFEHTIAVKRTGPDILSDHSYIEKAVSDNPNLRQETVADLV